MPKKKPAEFPHVSDSERYVRDVLAGRIPACKWIKLACERHRRDVASSATKAFPYEFDEAKADRVCRFMEFLPHVKGSKWAKKNPDGKPNTVVLEPWQKFVLCSIFGWVRKSNGMRRFGKARIYIPRKNGKSMLSAGIGLYMLTKDGESGSEVYSGATSEKQAWEVFGPAKQMLIKRAELAGWLGVDVRAQSLVMEEDNSKFLPIIGKPGDGASPHCAITDEYHEHKTSDLLDTMETGMGSREQALSLVISTAGTDLAGPCREDWQICEKILQNLEGFRDDTLFCAIWTIDEDDRWDSEESLKKANPNWGVSIIPDRILSELQAAKQNPRLQSKFKTKYLNQWVSAKNTFFNVHQWETLGRDIKREDFKEFPSYLAGDLASKHDIVALMHLFCLPDNRYALFGDYYLPEATLDRPENQHYRTWHAMNRIHIAGDDITDLEEFKARAIELSAEYRVEEFPFDPNRAWGVMPALEREGLPVVEYRNTVLMMSEPMKQLEALIRAGRIIHDGDPVLTWAIGNTTGKIDNKDNVYPNKESAAQKIDPVVGSLMALGRAMTRDDHAAGPFFAF